jgi:aspartyl-tRNA(Asn)/glutamyl-tRNA(Gln) amidotransferase subunit C
MHKVTVSPEEVRKIAKLANLRLQPEEVELFATQFTQTIDVVNQLQEIDTSAVSGTYQVNNLSNVTREDIVDTDRILPHALALREAKLTHNGFFVVPRVIDSSEEL